MKKLIIAASILDANYLNLRLQLDLLAQAQVDWLHYDVMDGHFVPNLSFGAKVLKDISTHYDIFIDCHLMVTIKQNIKQYLMPYVKAKTNSITLHFESLSHEQIREFILFCQENKVKKSLAIKPDTNIAVLNPYLQDLDMVLIMSVNPGLGGQKFITNTISKIKDLKQEINKNQYRALIQVDGGINQETAVQCYRAGADIIVVGSYLINHKDLVQAVKELKNGK